MNINEAVLNILELSEVLIAAHKPYVENRYGVLHSRSYKPLIKTLTVLADAIRHDEITDPQHPNVELFVDLFRESYIPWDISESHWMFEPAPKLVQRINQFLNDYVRYTQTDDFIKQLSNMRRRKKRNTTSLLSYTNNLFDVYSRLLVVRVDFHYQPEYYEGLTVQQVIDDREAFLRNIKRYFRHLVGLCWKLEYEPQRKFHYHFIFFFDGNKMRQDISLGRMLGEHWVDITGNTGSYHNCNYADKTYPEKYLGMIHYSDEIKRRALRHAAYLTKNDENILAILCNGQARIFGRMETPRRAAAGRPRLRDSL